MNLAAPAEHTGSPTAKASCLAATAARAKPSPARYPPSCPQGGPAPLLAAINLMTHRHPVALPGVVLMRALSRSLEMRASGQWAVLIRALVVLMVAMAIIMPLMD